MISMRRELDDRCVARHGLTQWSSWIRCTFTSGPRARRNPRTTPHSATREDIAEQLRRSVRSPSPPCRELPGIVLKDSRRWHKFAASNAPCSGTRRVWASEGVGRGELRQVDQAQSARRRSRISRNEASLWIPACVSPVREGLIHSCSR